MKLRYEEYTDAQGSVPFVLNDNIRRTASRHSEAQNWHENLEIQFCKEGNGAVLIDGKQYGLSRGAIAVINSNAIHYTFSNTEMVYACIIVSADFCRQMGIDHHRISFEPIVEDEKLCAIFEKICDEYARDSALRIASLSRLLLEMLIGLVRDHSAPERREATEKGERETVRAVLMYVRENYGERITLDDVAARVLRDKYTLCKIFKRNTGQTIFENVNSYRCMMAASYISRGATVAEAASLCGFENGSFFSRTFKKYMGVLPSKYVDSISPQGGA